LEKKTRGNTVTISRKGQGQNDRNWESFGRLKATSGFHANVFKRDRKKGESAKEELQGKKKDLGGPLMGDVIIKQKV